MFKEQIFTFKKFFKNKFFLLFLFSLFFLLTRLPGLGTDVINPDGVNWHYRSEQFIVALKSGQFERTYQHYHPGVTLTWIAGVSIEFIKQIFPNEVVYDHMNFLVYHTVVKTVLVFVQLVLTIVAIFFLNYIFQTQYPDPDSKKIGGGVNFFKLLLKKIHPKHNQHNYGFLKAILVVSLFTFEPFFLGNSRLFHLDVLLTLLLFIGLLLSYINLRIFKMITLFAASAFMALAFLTKSIGIGGIFYVLGFTILSFTLRKKMHKVLFAKIIVFGMVAFLVTTLFVFPALWVAPVHTIVSIFDEAERVGIRKGHGQIFFGDYTRDPGVLFYMLIAAMKTSPLTLYGFVGMIYLWLKNAFSRDSKILLDIPRIKNSLYENLKHPSFEFYLGVFYLGYILVMTYPSKKLDRYLLPMYPLFALYAVNFFYTIKDKIVQRKILGEKSYIVLVTSFFVFSLLYPIVKIYPYYFTYTSPIFRDAEGANSIIGQKPFGVGIYELRTLIFDNYSEEFGEYPNLGFIDIKPMRSIYRNSKIYDIRVSGTRRYDLLILGINEDFPEEVVESGTTFILDDTLYINNLPYWRIYKKDPTSVLNENSEE